MTWTFTTGADHDFKWWLDVVVACVTIVGAPIAITGFFVQKKREAEARETERLEREYGTYNTLDSKYIDYLNICLEFPKLDIFDVPLENYTPTEAEKRQELIIFSILIAILERAYLMYVDKSAEIRKKQWTGWDEYAREWAKRRNFQAAWDEQQGEFDGRFEKYLQDIINVIRTPVVGASAGAA